MKIPLHLAPHFNGISGGGPVSLNSPMAFRALLRPFFYLFMTASADLVSPFFIKTLNLSRSVFMALDTVFKHLLMLLVGEVYLSF